MWYVVVAGCVFALLALGLAAASSWWVAGSLITGSQAVGVALAPRVGRALAHAGGEHGVPRR